MNRIALVTGAGRGIGRAIALRLARDGFDIWGTFKTSEEKALEVKTQIESLGRRCAMFWLDVSSFEEVSAALKPRLEAIDHDREKLWAVVNNAGMTRDQLLGWMKPEEFGEVIAANLVSVFNVTRVVMDELMRQKGGRVVNMTSLAGHSGNPGQSNYAASKAGVMGFTKSVAKEVARMKVTVNAVAAGFIATDMTAALPVDELKKTIPMRRFGTPEEVAAVVSFLCGDDASYITGAIVDVNGGLY